MMLDETQLTNTLQHVTYKHTYNTQTKGFSQDGTLNKNVLLELLNIKPIKIFNYMLKKRPSKQFMKYQLHYKLT